MKLMRSPGAMLAAAMAVVVLGVIVAMLSGRPQPLKPEGDVNLQGMGVPLSNTGVGPVPLSGSTAGTQLQPGGAASNPQTVPGGNSLVAPSGGAAQQGSASSALQAAGTASPSTIY